jgi:hypothetical protein
LINICQIFLHFMEYSNQWNKKGHELDWNV